VRVEINQEGYTVIPYQALCTLLAICLCFFPSELVQARPSPSSVVPLSSVITLGRCEGTLNEDLFWDLVSDTPILVNIDCPRWQVS